MNATNFTLRTDLRTAVQELKRRLDTRSDVVGDTRQMDIQVRDGAVHLAAVLGTPMSEFLGTQLGTVVNNSALPQIFEKSAVSVPAVFGRKLIAEQPEIAQEMLRGLLQKSEARRLVRIQDGRIRAFLSDKYRCLDNFDLAAHALDVASDVGAEPIECSLTDDHFRMKLTCRKFWGEIVQAQDKKNDGGAASMAHHFVRSATWNGGSDLPGGLGTVFPLVTLSNSETGHGGCNVSLGILHAVCLNGAIVQKELAAIHLGGKLESGLMSNETRQADAKAIYLKARDIFRAAFDEGRFRTMIAGIQENAARPIASPRAALDQLIQDTTLAEGHRDAIFDRWFSDYQKTVGGLSGAVSRYSQEVADPDAAEELEELAGTILSDRKLGSRLMSAAAV
jgi:hypothetical protein